MNIKPQTEIFIASRVKNPDANNLPNNALKIAEETGNLSLEITVKPSGFKKISKYIKRVEDLGKSFRKTNIRFHAEPGGEMDFSVEGEEGKKAVKKIKSIINFVSENIEFSYLTVHAPGSGIRNEEKAVSRLKALVEYGERRGVVVSLENLASGWTSNPIVLQNIVKDTSSSVTLDIGHINSCSLIRNGKMSRNRFLEYLGPYIVGAHIYEFEEGRHVCPQDPYIVFDLMELLLYTNADWWVFELTEKDDFEKMYGWAKQIIYKSSITKG